MAKREQTTGLPRRRRTTSEREIVGPKWLDNLLGHPHTREERDDAINRVLVRGSVALGVIIVLLIGAALFYNNVIIPGQTVASVNGEAITAGEFRDRVEFERARVTQQINGTVSQLQAFGFTDEQINQQFSQEPYSTWLNELNFPDQLGQRVLDDMVEDKLIAQDAAERNITIDEETIQAGINDFYGYDPTQVALIGVDPTETPIPTETPTPFVSPTPTTEPTATPLPTDVPEDITPEAEATVTNTPFPTLEPTSTPLAEEQQATQVAAFEENQSAFSSYIRQNTGLGSDAIDAFFERRALRDALQADVAGDMSTTTYVNSRHILVDTEEQALEILDALQNGESFSELARAASQDPGSAANGGELGWAAAANYYDEFRDAVLSLPIGEISGPIQTQAGYHIIQVRAREERETEEQERDQLAASAFLSYLDNLRAENEANIEIADNWPDYVPQ